jgi:hypothetical protein
MNTFNIGGYHDPGFLLTLYRAYEHLYPHTKDRRKD